MQLLERSMKNRICELVNAQEGPLAYPDQPMDQLAGRLLEQAIAWRDEAAAAVAKRKELEEQVEDLERQLEDA